MPHSTAFYPCCGSDVDEPRAMLSGIVDQIIYCDINPIFSERSVRQASTAELPAIIRLNHEALAAVSEVERIDVLFYRRDSTGEGGSGLFVIGDVFLRPLLAAHQSTLRLIITDGSNSRGANFKRMTRTTGLIKFGKHFKPASLQPLLASHGLWMIDVMPLPRNSHPKT